MNNLQIEDTQLEDKDVYESPEYINDLGKFIERDFKNFRFQKRNIYDTQQQRSKRDFINKRYKP